MENSKGELVPGGLAIGFGFVVDTCRNGMQCEVVEFIDPYFDAVGYEFDTFVKWSDGSESDVTRRKLLPINPEPDPLEITNTEELTCPNN